jgi:hypothetical protein
LRPLLRRHFRIVSIVGGALFALLAWGWNAWPTDAVSLLLLVLMGVVFTASMWRVGRAFRNAS